MFPKVPRILRSIFKTIFVIVAWVGILLLPSDISDLSETYGIEEWSIPTWLDREGVVLVLLALMSLYLVWTDLRPFALRLWHRHFRQETFSIGPHIMCESRYIRTPSAPDTDTGLMQNVFYLVVGNMRYSGRTLTRVQARLFFVGPPTLCPIKDSSSESVDIRHGEYAYFEVFRVASKIIYGSVVGSVEMTDDKVAVLSHNIDRDEVVFDVFAHGSATTSYGLVCDKERSPEWRLMLVISADDERARRVTITIDSNDPEEPVRWDDPAGEIWIGTGRLA